MSATALGRAAQSAGIRSPLLRVAGAAGPSDGEGLLQALLREQQTLTAVERFAKQHDACAVPAQAKYYRDLIPLERPAAGQQYAFEVDLDACTGCKACVAACHTMNGLDEGEVWRTVGLLHGGTVQQPAQQTVTTSCHHCVDPACLKGCPVKAYEKDPITGIVRHLDDQCIGCQYCTLMCPYDAPKYSRSRGIVRKCDMCSQRLLAGEAPACVQACPNQAISIRVVDQQHAIQASEAGTFLPGAPAPDHTIPTTVYRSARPAPSNLLPADFYQASPEHPHPPLVLMLVLTQLAVGAFAAHSLIGRLFPIASARFMLVQAILSLALAFVAIGAATFHLGRPQYAFRAVLGLRTSWMSREILAFGLFAKATALFALSVFPGALPAFPGKDLIVGLREVWETAVIASGLFGVLCSVMIYAATRRAHWNAAVTGFKFLASTVLLGAAAACVSVGAMTGGPPSNALQRVVIVTAALKLTFELSCLRHLGDRQHTAQKRIALLMIGELKPVAILRLLLGTVGGVILPMFAMRTGHPALPTVAFGLLLIGELAERYLFFRAAPASRMPGALS